MKYDSTSLLITAALKRKFAKIHMITGVFPSSKNSMPSFLLEMPVDGEKTKVKVNSQQLFSVSY
mgnify:FL=1